MISKSLKMHTVGVPLGTGLRNTGARLLNVLFMLEDVGSYHILIQISGIAFCEMSETQIHFHLKCSLKTHLFIKDNSQMYFIKLGFPSGVLVLFKVCSSLTM